jgi:hypothetical protein
MSIIGPLIFAAYILIPMFLATMKDTDIKTVAVIDESMMFTSYTEDGPKCVIPDREYLKFKIVQNMSAEEMKEGFEQTGYYALLFIPDNIFASKRAVVYSPKSASLDVTGYIERRIEDEMESLKLAKYEIENILRGPGDARCDRGKGKPDHRSNREFGKAFPIDDGKDHRRRINRADSIRHMDHLFNAPGDRCKGGLLS